MDRDTAEPDTGGLPGPNAEAWIARYADHPAPGEYSHEFVRDVTPHIGAAALERGPLTLECGKRTVRPLPPLDSTEREIGMGVSIFHDAAKAVDSGSGGA